MKIIIIFWAICVQIVAQALDINSMRMANPQFPLTDVNSESQARIIHTMDQPIQKDTYLVGPGDQFQINILSSDDVFTYKLVVSPSGEILIPSVGVIQVYGLTLTETIKSLESMIQSWNQNARIHITLSQIRQFKIKVIGHLDNPGYYVATPMTRVQDIFKQVIRKERGNPPPLAETTHETPTSRALSQRNILLKRNGATNRIDLERFGMLGDEKYNPRIRQGDVIYIPLEINRVSIYGGIRFKGRYEYVENETLFELIQLAGGFTKDVDSSKIGVTRFINDIETKVINIKNFEQIKTFVLEPDDHIIIRHKKDYRRQDLVKISGEVKYPGMYSILPGKTILRDILNQAGGYATKADHSRIKIFSKGIGLDIEAERIHSIPYSDRVDTELSYLRARIRAKKKGVNLTSEKMVSKAMNFKLERGDAIFIPKYFGSVGIIGGIVYPGRYPFEPDMNYKDYIKLAGGLTKFSNGKIYIMNSETGTKILAKTIKNISNGDTIFIDEKIEYRKWDRFLEIMSVAGQIATIIIVAERI